MKILMILLLLAAIVVYLNRHKAPQVMLPLLIGLVVATLFAAVWNIYTATSSGTRSKEYQKAEVLFKKSVGYRLGREVAKDIPEGELIAVLLQKADNPTQRDKLDAFVDGLQEGFGRAQYDLVEVEQEPMSTDDGLSVPPPLTSDLISEVLADNPDASALIADIGFPELSGQNEKHPPIYAFANIDQSALEPLLERDILRACAHYRSNPQWNREPDSGMSLDEIFDLRYRLDRAP